MQNKIECIYETKKVTKAKKSKLTKKALAFFEANQPAQNETFVAIKTSADGEKSVDVYGAYFGSEFCPVDVYAKKWMNMEKAFLAEATDVEAMKSFIEKKGDESIYLFKVRYEEFETQEITSFYADKYEMDVMVYNAHEEDEERGEVLQVFGEDRVSMVFPPMDLEE